VSTVLIGHAAREHRDALPSPPVARAARARRLRGALDAHVRCEGGREHGLPRARRECVRLVREEGRDVSSQYGRRDQACPVSTGGRGGERGGSLLRARRERGQPPERVRRRPPPRAGLARVCLEAVVVRACGRKKTFSTCRCVRNTPRTKKRNTPRTRLA